MSIISLSPHGRQAMRTVQLARKKRIATLLRDWSTKDRRELARLLAKLNDEINQDITRGA